MKPGDYIVYIQINTFKSHAYIYTTQFAFVAICCSRSDAQTEKIIMPPHLSNLIWLELMEKKKIAYPIW